MSPNLTSLTGLTLGLTFLGSAVGAALVEPIRRIVIKPPRESHLSDILQFESVLDDGMTLLGKDGSITQTLYLSGQDISAMTLDEMKAQFKKRQSWLDRVAEEGCSFKIITTREERSYQMDANYGQPILQSIHDKWMDNFERSYVNHHYIVLTYTPKRSGNASAQDMWRQAKRSCRTCLKSTQAKLSKPIIFFCKHRQKNKIEVTQEKTPQDKTIAGKRTLVLRHPGLSQLNEMVNLTLEALHDFGPRVLTNGSKNVPGALSPLLSFWGSLLNRKHHPIAPFNDHLSERLTSSMVQYCPKSGEIVYQDGQDKVYEAVISLKSWGEESPPHILREVLSLPGCITVLHMGQGHKRISSKATLEHRLRQSNMVFGTQKTRDEFNSAMELVQSGESSYYTYQLCLFISGKSSQEVQYLLSEIKRIFRSYGISPVSETGAAEWLWRCQFPGYKTMVRATHPLSHNLAYLIPFESDAEGLPKCDWGKGALRLFKTPSGHAYSLQLHSNEGEETKANSVVIAPAGSGKTTLFEHLIGGALRHKNLRAYIFDRFNGTRIFTQAVGGTYIDLGRGDESEADTAGKRALQDNRVISHIPLNPFVCEDTLANRVFLSQFLCMLAGRGDEDQKSFDIAMRAVDLILTVPIQHRTLNAMWESAFDAGSDLKEGLKKWIQPSPLGHWFNGVHPHSGHAYDALDLTGSRLVSFEMTEVQRSPVCAAAMTTYIMHRIRTLVRENASPHMIFIDETAPMLEDPIFRGYVKTLFREHRKLRGSINVCFQNAQAIEQSGLRDVILEQCSTFFLFPNPAAKREDYFMFDLTDAQWSYIKGTSQIGRRLKHSVLVKRQDEAVILDVDLSGLGPLLKLYRSGSRPVKLVRELQQKWGMERWVEEYLAS